MSGKPLPEPDDFWTLDQNSQDFRDKYVGGYHPRVDIDAFEAQLRANLAETARRLQLALGQGIPVQLPKRKDDDTQK